MDGHMRAYDMKSGTIIWVFDAARDSKTGNGIPAKGGAFSSTGPTIASGFLYITCGPSGIPGNVLLALVPAL
jgi:polyvinyl alcohol dehydrogenase (cytochrome)